MTPYRKPNRLKEFDYSSDNLYYITTNVKGRHKCFGHIQNEIMHLNILVEIVKAQWLWLEQQYSYIKLHEYIIMPDHFHGIIEINKSLIDFPNHEVEIADFANDPDASVRTGRDLSLQTHPDHNHISESLNNSKIKIKSLSELIGAFKMTASKKIHELGLDFEWQRSFNDEIIMDEEAFLYISNYIRDNAKNWNK